MSQILRQKAARAARDVLGFYLCRRTGGRTERFRITETEAYGGRFDRGSHAFSVRLGRIRQTPRNAPMWSKAGTIYVYFTYGMHFMLNIVTGEKGAPSAILIRGVEGVNGPGRVARKLRVGRSLNGKILGKKTGLWIEKGAETGRSKKARVTKAPRVGIPYAGPVWSAKPYRFILSDTDNG